MKNTIAHTLTALQVQNMNKQTKKISPDQTPIKFMRRVNRFVFSHNQLIIVISRKG